MLQISNLSKTYPNGVQALKDVTLDISNGMFGLLGPNGAGKTTTFYITVGLVTPDEGKVFLDNGGWVKKEKLENELIENSRKSLELAEANNKLTLSNKKIAKNTFIATIIGIIITILTSSSISKLSCNTINVGTKPPITDTVKDKQNN